MAGDRSPWPSSTTSRSNPKATSKPKFSVYQNEALSAALSAHSARSNLSALLILCFLSSVSLFSLFSRKADLVRILTLIRIPPVTSQYALKFMESALGLVLLVVVSASFRSILQYSARNSTATKKPKDQKTALTERQLGLIGLKSERMRMLPELTRKHSDLKPVMASSEPLVPIRKSSFSYATPPRTLRSMPGQFSSSGEKKTQTSSPLSPVVPWSRQSFLHAKGIQTEAMLERFLEEADEQIEKRAEFPVVSATSLAVAGTPGIGIASPGSLSTSATPSGAVRRPVRMSPGSHQKYKTPPKKGEGELPPPMPMEQAIDAFDNLGIYPQIELWRDCIRQWFSSAVMNPLLAKIKTSHIQVQQSAANINVSVVVSQVGCDLPSNGTSVTLSPVGIKDWQPTVTLDEDGILHQLRASLLQVRDRAMTQPFGSPQQPIQNLSLPAIQACIDTITEHQRLNTLMKGELIKGLLPHSSVRADYSVQRVQELAEGTCLKNYMYLANGDGYDKEGKKWTSELPTDSHLLLYLFAAFLEHPKWMLHVDPSSYCGAQSSKNPLFLGVLPPKDRFPEKYVAIISGVPATVHPGACMLTIGKQNPPVFALYWDKKLQFSLQGRTALWDAIILLCHRIVIDYGGIVRGVHLGSSALNILSALESETES